MKTFPLAAAAWLLGAAIAAAQEPSPIPVRRGDAHLVLGWQNLHKEQPQQRYNDWVNRIFYGGAGAGFYWTEHLKTQVDVGTGTKGRQYRYDTIVVNGQTTGSSARVGVQQQNLAIAQHYQFFRNQWFHPHVGAGLAIAREKTSTEYQPVIVFDSVTRTSREVRPARTEGPDHRTMARPFVETGFKAYMTRRAFFASDARVMVKRGFDEVLVRFGFGVDF